MFGKFSLIALLAGLAVAQKHEPTGAEPVGNPITRPLNEVVPAGKAFEITWDPTTTGTVSLVLLKGPSTNAVKFADIVQGIPNSGKFTWTPSTDLAPTVDAHGYGIQLVDDATGQYQYSTQFGISNDKAPVSSSASAATDYGNGYPTPSSSIPSYESSKPAANSTAIYTPITSSHPVASTGYPVSNTSIIYPTKSMSVPSSLKTSATGGSVPSASSTTSSPPQSTGAAGSLRAGLGLVGAMVAEIGRAHV